MTNIQKIEEDVELPENEEPVEHSLSEKVKEVKQKMEKIEAAFQVIFAFLKVIIQFTTAALS